MKKRILYTVLLAAGLAFSSCSDQFLQDMNPCIITIFISRV